MYFRTPKQKKFRKYHKLKKSNYAKNNKRIKDYCLEKNVLVWASKSSQLSLNELEALCLVLKKNINKKEFQFNVNPDFFLTSKLHFNTQHTISTYVN